MTVFDERYQEYLCVFEGYLDEYLEKFQTKPPILGESMKYSLKVGGKRVRPVLLLAIADVLGVEKADVLPFALALEMIHTYSLIHDDLPSMDDDDFRRGKPSNHKAFGEGNAVLAGDGLLNTAYSLCFSECLKGEKQTRAAALLCEFAGVFGMIAGQSADLTFTGGVDATEEDLLYVYQNKTGKLLCAPALIASILAGDKYYFELERFALDLGLLFQVTDDILDEESSFAELGKTVGKDKKDEKLTSIRFYGLSGAKIAADMYAQNCYAVLDALEGDTAFLHDLVSFVRSRKN